MPCVSCDNPKRSLQSCLTLPECFIASGLRRDLAWDLSTFFIRVDYDQTTNALARMLIPSGFGSGLGFGAPCFGHSLHLQSTYATESTIINCFVLTTPGRTGVSYCCLLDGKLEYRKRQRQISKSICGFQSPPISVCIHVNVILSVCWSFGTCREYAFTNLILREWDLWLDFTVQPVERRKREVLLRDDFSHCYGKLSRPAL